MSKSSSRPGIDTAYILMRNATVLRKGNDPSGMTFLGISIHPAIRMTPAATTTRGDVRDDGDVKLLAV